MSCCCCRSPPSPRPLDPDTSGSELWWTITVMLTLDPTERCIDDAVMLLHRPLLTFCSVTREIVSASRRGHLNRCSGSSYSPIMVLMETDALLFSGRKYSTGHNLCSFLNFLQDGVGAS